MKAFNGGGKMNDGLIHVYYGDGKGKTTAAMGLALRAAGCGNKVTILQFLKGRPTGEANALRDVPGITLVRGQQSGKFSWEMTEEEKRQVRQLDDGMLKEAFEKAGRGECDLLVLDEALGACNAGLLDADALLALLREKPHALEVVLTGRGPWRELLELAGYATEMRKEKHPFDNGVAAREGVEF